MKQQEFKTIVLEHPNGTTTVHIPILTAEEREERMKAIKKSVEKLMR